MEQLQEQEQKLWCDVYTSVCRSGQGERIAAFLADSAVSAFKERFGGTNEQEAAKPTPVTEIEKLRAGLENCRLLAARHRKEDWALLILGFCAEAGVVGSITR